MADLTIHGHAAKTTPVSADEFIIYDSAASTEKKVTYANLLATLIAGALSHTVVAKTADYNVAAADLYGNKTFTNTGAAGAINLTLPAGSANAKLDVLVTVAQYLKLTANTTQNFRFGTETSKTSGSSYIRSNAIGAHFSIKWSGTQWVVTVLSDIPVLYDE